MLDTSAQAAIGVAALSVLLPFAIRVLFSPWTFLLLLPSLVSTAVLAGWLLNVYLGFQLDKQRVQPRPILPHVARPFAFSTPAAWQAVLTRSEWSHMPPRSLPALRRDMPVVSQSINDILTMVVRDFVLIWYTDISSSPSFPTAVSEMLHRTMESLVKRIEDVDMASLIVRHILPALTVHVEKFRNSEVALRGAGLERHLTQSEELDLLLASRYAGKTGSLHSAVDNLSSTFTKQSEEAHLRQLVDSVLPLILPPKDANSRAVRIVAREIVACAVLSPLMEMLADPDFWNRTIDQLVCIPPCYNCYIQPTLQCYRLVRQYDNSLFSFLTFLRSPFMMLFRKLISKVRNLLESQSPSPVSTRTSLSKRPETEVITFRTNARHFEAFLRSISRCDSLLDARRLKNDIGGEIRRTRALLGK